MLGKLKDIHWHSSWEKCNLDFSWEVLEDVLDLSLESSWKHFVSFIETEDSKMISLQEALFHHVQDSSWSTDYDVNSLLENSDFISNDGTSDASVHLDTDELANSLHDVSDLLSKLSGGCDNQGLGVDWSCINNLKNWNGKATSLASTWLSLKI